MSTPVVVESTVLVAFCDPADPLHEFVHQAVADQITAGHPLVVPASALAEVLVGAYQTSPHAVRTVEGFVSDLAATVYPVDREVARAAAQYRADNPGLPLLAAFVFGTAKTVNAQQILTTNLGWKGVDDRTVILR